MDTEIPARAPIGISGRGHLTGMAGWMTVGLFVVPLLLILFKLSDLPGSETMRGFLTLSGLQGNISHHLRIIMFVPLGALLIVIFRITLGIRVLGPFRSILLAIAFQVTGITVGLIFLSLVVLVIVAVRPSLRAIRLPYFARVAVILSLVVAMIVAAIDIGKLADIGTLTEVAFFPIVVLCLTGDGFAKTLNREGLRSALWRGAMTAIAAVIITGLTSLDILGRQIMRFPELIFAQIGMIIVVSEYFGFRLLAPLNPPPVKSKDRKKKKKESIESNKEHEASSVRNYALAGEGGTVNHRRREK